MKRMIDMRMTTIQTLLIANALINWDKEQSAKEDEIYSMDIPVRVKAKLNPFWCRIYETHRPKRVKPEHITIRRMQLSLTN